MGNIYENRGIVFCTLVDLDSSHYVNGSNGTEIPANLNFIENFECKYSNTFNKNGFFVNDVKKYTQSLE